MGAPHHVRYQMTSHALQRYRERINGRRSKIDITKHIRNALARAEYLSTERNRCEIWIDREEHLVMTLDPAQYKVVTVYNSLDEYENKVQQKAITFDVEEEDSEKSFNSLPERVRDLMGEYAYEMLKSEERRFYSTLAPMYIDYGEQMEKLARTRNPNYYKDNEEELIALGKEIQRLQTEQEEVLDALRLFFE